MDTQLDADLDEALDWSLMDKIRGVINDGQHRIEQKKNDVLNHIRGQLENRFNEYKGKLVAYGLE